MKIENPASLRSDSRGGRNAPELVAAFHRNDRPESSGTSGRNPLEQVADFTGIRTSKGKPFKGRNCARKMSKEFRYMEADMYNLVPAIGEINGLQSNYSYAMIPGEKREFGNWNMEIQDRKAEPPPDKRGDIARTYFGRIRVMESSARRIVSYSKPGISKILLMRGNVSETEE